MNTGTLRHRRGDRSTQVIALTALAALSLAACGSDDDDASNDAGGAGSDAGRAGSAGRAGAGGAGGSGVGGAGGSGAGGHAGGGQNAGEGGAGGGGASDGDAGQSDAGRDEWTACGDNSDCVLTPLACCACGTQDEGGVTAVHKDHVSDFFTVQCSPPVPCPDILCPPPPPRRFVATCDDGRCAVIDLTESEATACDQSTDCRVRTADCCPCGGSTELGALVAHSDENAFTALVCDEDSACPECAPIYPNEVSATCGAQGHCTLSDPRDGL